MRLFLYYIDGCRRMQCRQASVIFYLPCQIIYWYSAQLWTSWWYVILMRSAWWTYLKKYYAQQTNIVSVLTIVSHFHQKHLKLANPSKLWCCMHATIRPMLVCRVSNWSKGHTRCCRIVEFIAKYVECHHVQYFMSAKKIVHSASYQGPYSTETTTMPFWCKNVTSILMLCALKCTRYCAYQIRQYQVLFP